MLIAAVVAVVVGALVVIALFAILTSAGLDESFAFGIAVVVAVAMGMGIGYAVLRKLGSARKRD